MDDGARLRSPPPAAAHGAAAAQPRRRPPPPPPPPRPPRRPAAMPPAFAVAAPLRHAGPAPLPAAAPRVGPPRRAVAARRPRPAAAAPPPPVPPPVPPRAAAPRAAAGGAPRARLAAVRARVRAAVAPRQVDRAIAKIALPALGTLALDPLVALADMACVGYLGAAALGGVGVSNNVFNLSFTCFNFLGMATTPAIARAFGRGDDERASRLIAQALWVAALSGVAAMTLLFRYTVPVVAFFGANPAIVPSAAVYLRARLVAAPFFLASMVANGAFRGFQDTRTPLLCGLVANVINLTLYPTLIFGLGMGIAGAGVAMAAGQIVAGVALLALLVREKRLNLADLARVPSPTDVLPLLRIGAVLSVRTLSIFTTISYATATAAKLGTVEVAAFEIGRQIFALFARLLDAVSVAAQSLVALALGQSNNARARHIGNRILQLGVGLGAVFAFLLLIGQSTVPGLFTSDPAVRAMVAKTFPYMAVTQPLNGLVFVFDGIYTAGRKFTLLSAAIFAAALLSSATLYFVRTSALTLPNVWIGLSVMMVLRASLLGVAYLTRWSPVPRLRRPPQGPREAGPRTAST